MLWSQTMATQVKHLISYLQSLDPETYVFTNRYGGDCPEEHPVNLNTSKLITNAVIYENSSGICYSQDVNDDEHAKILCTGSVLRIVARTRNDTDVQGLGNNLHDNPIQTTKLSTSIQQPVATVETHVKTQCDTVSTLQCTDTKPDRSRSIIEYFKDMFGISVNPKYLDFSVLPAHE
jgi:hypothetical protein